MKIKKFWAIVLVFSLLTSFISCAPASLNSERSFEWFDTVTTVSAYMDDGEFDAMVKTHERWWKDFWNKSSISIHDEELENMLTEINGERFVYDD